MKRLGTDLYFQNKLQTTKNFLQYNALSLSGKYKNTNKRAKLFLLGTLLLAIVCTILFFVIINNIFSENIYLQYRSKKSVLRVLKAEQKNPSKGVGGPYLPDPISTPLNFLTYVVKSGDSIHSIAKKLFIDEVTIIKANNITIPSRIWAGMQLRIPNQDGFFIPINRKNSLEKVSKKYGFEQNDLLRINNLEVDEKITSVFVPGIHLDAITKSLILGEYFKRPTYGRFRSGFGWRRDPFTRKRSFHTGVDIANRKGTYIYAAGPGKIIYAGKNWPYGYMIKIQHTSGYTTIYGHLSKILVRRNSWVSMGTVIALMGSSGRSTGPHLHYEVRKYNRLVNPFSVTVF